MTDTSINYGNSFVDVRIGKLMLYFSYDTLIAFQSPKTGFVIRQNAWSTTTGKHLNMINSDHSIRISGEDFELEFQDLLRHYNLDISLEEVTA